MELLRRYQTTKTSQILIVSEQFNDIILKEIKKDSSHS